MSNRPSIVLDTNVLVAALRSRRGASAALLAKVATEAFDVNVSVALVLEYEEVFARNLVGTVLTAERANEVVSFLCANGRRWNRIRRLRPLVDDPDDELVAELALTCRCDLFGDAQRTPFWAN
jgi:predicted nucleic acid-binding protein